MNSKHQLPQDIEIPSSPEYDQALNTAAIRAAAVFDDALESSITPLVSFFHLFVRKEMETTSRMEGTQVTFQDVMLSEDKEDSEKSPDTREAYGVLRAFVKGEHILNEGIPISNRFIKTMHQALMVWAKNSPGRLGNSETFLCPLAIGIFLQNHSMLQD